MPSVSRTDTEGRGTPPAWSAGLSGTYTRRNSVPAPTGVASTLSPFWPSVAGASGLTVTVQRRCAGSAEAATSVNGLSLPASGTIRSSAMWSWSVPVSR